MRIARLFALCLVLPVAACAPARSALEVTTARLADAATPEARAAAVAERLADAGTTPLGDGRVRPQPGDVRTWRGAVAAFIPGRDPVRRAELVTVAAPLGAPEAAALVEAARRVVAQAAHGSPHRSVLVAFWRDDPAEIGRLPVWPDSLRAPVVALDAADVAGLTADGLVAHVTDILLTQADTVAHRPALRSSPFPPRP